MTPRTIRNFVIAVLAGGIVGSAAYLYRHMDDRTVTGSAMPAPPTSTVPAGTASMPEKSSTVPTGTASMLGKSSMVPAGTASMLGKSSMIPGGGAPRMGEGSTEAIPTIDIAAERMAKRLQANGGSGDEWALLARTYVELKRFPDAVNAYARAIEKLPGNEALLAEQASARASATAAPAR